MRIAVIGLGNMGAPMAANLVAAGHAVMGVDPVAPCPAGVTAADTAAAAARDADVVLTMLPHARALRDVAAQVIPAMQSRAVLCDCSTVDVATTRAVAAQGDAAGLSAVDAPVSGGITGAAAGKLTFMVGGPDAAVATCAPLFAVMGQRYVHCGGAGAGQAAKICNNMILGATMAVTCEAFALADRLGLDRARLFDVASTSSGQSWSLTSYCPAPGVGPDSPADNAYAPGFAAELMLKDLQLARQAATEAGLDTPIGTRAADTYATFVGDEGGTGRDFSALLTRYAPPD